MNLLKILLVMTLILLSYPQLVQAWGGRGHAAICESAVHLVKSPELKEYLQSKPHMMAHLCNVPDIYWKSISDESRKLGDPTHFIDFEILGLKITDVPTDFSKIVESYTGSENKFQDGSKIFSIPKELGSVWWRTDQFYRRAVAEATKLKTAEAPKGSKEEQDDNLPYNEAFYNMIVNLGVMGHFIGDASQPFHNTTDYDGYAANQGGIHGYYEEAVVAYFGSDLVSQITKKAAKLNAASYTKSGTVIEKMRAFSDIASNEIKAVLKVDPITQPSSLRIEKGMSIKKAAVRKSPAEGLKRFDKLIISQMARASVLLAHLWDQAYIQAGSPSIQAYRSYRYPFTPEFVTPDYFDIKAESNTKKK